MRPTRTALALAFGLVAWLVAPRLSQADGGALVARGTLVDG